MGGTAYFIVEKDAVGRSTNLLIDSPPNEPETLAFIADQGGVKQWVITHRGAMGKVKALQAALHCDVLVQEQEAYLLPDVDRVVTYRDRYDLGGDRETFWTPGHSPGSACVYSPQHGGVLFTGRHLLPDRAGQLRPLRFSKTFHWRRQLSQVSALQARFSSATLAYICPAANTGFLRGQYVIPEAYAQLRAIAPADLMEQPALL